MKPQIKKTIFGSYEVQYQCPGCRADLKSPLLEAGTVDQCPTCGKKFRVPGSKQRKAYEEKIAREEAEREAEKKHKAEEKALRLQERKIAAEEKKLQQEERRQQQEEARKRQELALERERDEQRRKNLTELSASAADSPHIHISTNQLGDVAECPFCAELISLRARKCKHCNEILDPVLRAAERNSEVPQIVNIVHGSEATATAVASAETKSSVSGCGGCLALVILFFIIMALAA